MADMNIFDGDAFSTFELTAALDKMPHKPQFLGSLGIFEAAPVRTVQFAVEKRDGALALVQTTPRGAPLPQQTKDPRDIRDFRTVRVAKGDTMQASEIQSVRAFGTSSELEQMQVEIGRRMMKVRNDVELTHEHMRLGALQGLVLDADGSTLYDWFSLWGIVAATEIDFALDAASPASGAVWQLCQNVIRAMQRASKGAWVQGTYVAALCGDTFYDQLARHPEVVDTFKFHAQAEQLRNEFGKSFQSFRFGDILWINYRGTDDNSTVAIPTTKAKFFPIGAPGVFQHVMSPGETFDWVNTPGQPFYSLLVRDLERDMWIQPEVYSYPAYVCLRPEMLQSARNT